MKTEEYLSDNEIKELIIKKKKKKKSNFRVLAVLLISILALIDSFFIGKYIGNKRYEKEMSTINVVKNIPIVNTAKKQIGNVGGKPFWSWYGFDSYVAWCACFVSWCENENGYIKENKAPKFAVTGDGAYWFKSKKQWKKPGTIPKAGDIIFFDWECDGLDNHVGIVAGTSDDGYIYTIEGNSSDMCRIKSYATDSKVIYGYGHIKID